MEILGLKIKQTKKLFLPVKSKKKKTCLHPCCWRCLEAALLQSYHVIQKWKIKKWHNPFKFCMGAFSSFSTNDMSKHSWSVLKGVPRCQTFLSDVLDLWIKHIDIFARDNCI